MKSLRSVVLTQTAVSDAGLANLKYLAALEEVILNRCPNLRGEGLANLKALPKLKTLRLIETKIEDLGLKHIGEMAGLEILDLGDSSLAFGTSSIEYPLTDAGLVNLRGLKNLEFLTIRSCANVSDKGMVAALKDKPKLHTLNIGRCPKLTDATLAEMKNLERLSTLWVDGTAVTDKGLVELEGHKPLSSLAIEKSKVTKDGVAKLKKALPKLSVNNP
jgi:hypothetical protein